MQNLREIQAKREYQLQKIGHDEQSFLLANIQAFENEGSDESRILFFVKQRKKNARNILFIFIETRLTSLYIDEKALTRDQVILPRDFLNYNLQRHIRHSGKYQQ